MTNYQYNVSVITKNSGFIYPPVYKWQIYIPVDLPSTENQTTLGKQNKLNQGSYYFAEFIFPGFSLTFPDKMNNFPWLISLFVTPVKQY